MSGRGVNRAPRFLLAALLLGLAGAGWSCADPFAGGSLAALPLPGAGEPGEEEWAAAVPLHVQAWKGNIHVRPEVVALDSETSHKSTAACHHGTDNSSPIPVALYALRRGQELFLRAEWEDPTPDQGESLGSWARGGEGGWVATVGADDGIAIMWGAPEDARATSAEGFRCQRACHMADVGLAGPATLMQMKMVAPAGKRYDTWRWRAGITAPYGVADDMVVEDGGKRGDEGQVTPSENRVPGGSAPLRAEGERPPYWTVEEPRGREAQVKARGGWRDGRYTVTFRRLLSTGDPDDLPFAPGDEAVFSISLFDNTFREHHVGAQSFRLLMPDRREPKREVELDPMDL